MDEVDEVAERLEVDQEFVNDVLLRKPSVKDELIPSVRLTLLQEIRRVPETNADKAFDAIFTNVPTVRKVNEFHFVEKELNAQYAHAVEAIEATYPDIYARIDFDNDAPISAARIRSVITNLQLLHDGIEAWETYWATHKLPKTKEIMKPAKRNQTKPLDISSAGLSAVVAICEPKGIVFKQQQGASGKLFVVSRDEVAHHLPAFFKERVELCNKDIAKESIQKKKPWIGIPNEFWETLEPVLYARTILNILDDAKVRKHMFEMWKADAPVTKMDTYLYARFMQMLKESYCWAEDCTEVRKTILEKQEMEKATEKLNKDLERADRKNNNDVKRAERQASVDAVRAERKASAEAKRADRKASVDAARAERTASAEAKRTERKASTEAKRAERKPTGTKSRKKNSASKPKKTTSTKKKTTNKKKKTTSTKKKTTSKKKKTQSKKKKIQSKKKKSQSKKKRTQSKKKSTK